MVPEHVASEEVDVPPGHGGDFLQKLECFLVAGGLVALQQFREQDGIVGDDGHWRSAGRIGC